MVLLALSHPSSLLARLLHGSYEACCLYMQRCNAHEHNFATVLEVLAIHLAADER